LIEVTPSSGDYVVVVNCEPYLAPPIGVRTPGPAGNDKFWSFPVRNRPTKSDCSAI